MYYIDTHTHTYDEAFRGCEDLAIDRAVAANVRILIQADVDSSERDRMLSLVNRHPDHLRAMAGLYPGSVDDSWREEIDLMTEHLDDPLVVAVGEIGLDYHFSTEFASQQKEAFRVQLEIAARHNLPVNIHLRDATEDFLKILEDCRGLGLRGNLHAYSGSYETFRHVQKYGDWFIGVGGVVTFKNAGIADVVRKVPIDRILLETDAPYLTPVPYRGKRNESAYIPIIAAKIAELKGMAPESVANETTRNACSLFEISQ